MDLVSNASAKFSDATNARVFGATHGLRLQVQWKPARTDAKGPKLLSVILIVEFLLLLIAMNTVVLMIVSVKIPQGAATEVV